MSVKLKYGKELQTGAFIFTHNGVSVYHVTKCGFNQSYWYCIGDIRQVGDFDVRQLPMFKETGKNEVDPFMNISHAVIIQDAIDRGIIR